MAAKTVPGVLASFAHVDSAVEAISGLKARGFRDLTVYTASPNHEIEQARFFRPAPVRAPPSLSSQTWFRPGNSSR